MFHPRTCLTLPLLCQIEHHLFPQLPRHNLKLVKPMVEVPRHDPGPHLQLLTPMVEAFGALMRLILASPVVQASPSILTLDPVATAAWSTLTVTLNGGHLCGTRGALPDHQLHRGLRGRG